MGYNETSRDSKSLDVIYPFISQAAASSLTSETRSCSLSSDSLTFLNTFLQEVLYLILVKAGALDLASFKEAISQLLPNTLGREAIVEAELEVKLFLESSGMEDYQLYLEARKTPVFVKGSLEPGVWSAFRDGCFQRDALRDVTYKPRPEHPSVRRRRIPDLIHVYAATTIEAIATHVLSALGKISESEDIQVVRIRDLFSTLRDDDFERLVSYGIIDNDSKRLSKPGPSPALGSKKSLEPYDQSYLSYSLTDLSFDDLTFDNLEFSTTPRSSVKQQFNTPQSSASPASLQPNASLSGTPGAYTSNMPTKYRPSSLLSFYSNSGISPSPLDKPPSRNSLQSQASISTISSAKSGNRLTKLFGNRSKTSSRASMTFPMVADEHWRQIQQISDLDQPLDFEQLMQSGQTLKVSLTPNRLKSIEIERNDVASADKISFDSIRTSNVPSASRQLTVPQQQSKQVPMSKQFNGVYASKASNGSVPHVMQPSFDPRESVRSLPAVPSNGRSFDRSSTLESANASTISSISENRDLVRGKDVSRERRSSATVDTKASANIPNSDLSSSPDHIPSPKVATISPQAVPPRTIPQQAPPTQQETPKPSAKPTSNHLDDAHWTETAETLRKLALERAPARTSSKRASNSQLKQVHSVTAVDQPLPPSAQRKSMPAEVKADSNKSEKPAEVRAEVSKPEKAEPEKVIHEIKEIKQEEVPVIPQVVAPAETLTKEIVEEFKASTETSVPPPPKQESIVKDEVQEPAPSEPTTPNTSSEKRVSTIVYDESKRASKRDSFLRMQSAISKRQSISDLERSEALRGRLPSEVFTDAESEAKPTPGKEDSVTTSTPVESVKAHAVDMPVPSEKKSVPVEKQSTASATLAAPVQPPQRRSSIAKKAELFETKQQTFAPAPIKVPKRSSTLDERRSKFLNKDELPVEPRRQLLPPSPAPSRDGRLSPLPSPTRSTSSQSNNSAKEEAAGPKEDQLPSESFKPTERHEHEEYWREQLGLPPGTVSNDQMLISAADMHLLRRELSHARTVEASVRVWDDFLAKNGGAVHNRRSMPGRSRTFDTLPTESRDNGERELEELRQLIGKKPLDVRLETKTSEVALQTDPVHILEPVQGPTTPLSPTSPTGVMDGDEEWFLDDEDWAHIEEGEEAAVVEWLLGDGVEII